MIKYIVTSESNEGYFFLVNNARKNNMIWSKYFDIEKTAFKTAGAAKTALTKLLKNFPEFQNDILRIECYNSENYSEGYFNSFSKNYQF